MKGKELQGFLQELTPEQLEYHLVFRQGTPGMSIQQEITGFEIVEINRLAGQQPIRREAEIRLT